MRKRSPLLALFCILTLILPGCTQKQRFVSAPRMGENAYHKSSPKHLSDQIRSVFKVSEINRWAQKKADRDSLLTRYPELEPLLRRVDLNPADLDAKRSLADALFERQLYRRAMLLYSELAAALPDDAQVQLALGRVWDALGAHAIALRYAINAVELDPESVSAMTLLGTVYLHREEPQPAAQAFVSALSRDPEDATLLANAGYAFLQMKDWQQAVDYLERAIERDPTAKTVRNNLGIAKVYLGDEEGALQAFLQISTAAIAYNNLGAAYLAQENWENARDAFTTALAWDPDYLKAQLNLREAESYLPPPAIVELTPFEKQYAWLPGCWESHLGITGRAFLELPEQELFPSSEELPFSKGSIDLTSALSDGPLPAQVQFVNTEQGLQAAVSPFRDLPRAAPLTGTNPEPAPLREKGLEQIAPLAFAVRHSEESPQTSQGPSSLEELMAGMRLPKSGPQRAPAETPGGDQLASTAVETPVPILGTTSPSTRRLTSLPPVDLAVGSVLHLLSTRPAFDWTALAQVPKAKFDERQARISTGLPGEPQTRSFPAQVWLPPSTRPVAVPRTPVPESDSLGEPALVLAALGPELPAPNLPFQILIRPPTPPRSRNLEHPASALSPGTDETARQRVAQIIAPPAETQRTQNAAVSAWIEPTAKLDSTRPAAEHPRFSFDQFAEIRQQILTAQSETADDPDQPQAAGIDELADQAPGLAGIAGLAMILFSMGATKLALKRRTGLRRFEAESPEED